MAALLAASNKKLAHLVVDAGPIIRGERLEHLASSFWTVPEVIAEIRDSKSRQRLQTLPYELRTKEPSVAAVRAVTEFAKKTGDLQALSITDLKVVALTYMLETDANGSSHLRKEPVSTLQPGQNKAPQKQPNSKAQNTQAKPSSEKVSPAAVECAIEQISNIPTSDEARVNDGTPSQQAVSPDAATSPLSTVPSSDSDHKDSESKEGLNETSTSAIKPKKNPGSWAAIASKPVQKSPTSLSGSTQNSYSDNRGVKEEVIRASSTATSAPNGTGVDYFAPTSGLAQAAIEKSIASEASAGGPSATEKHAHKATSRILTSGVSSTGNLDKGEDIAKDDDGEGWINESNMNTMAAAAWGKGGKSVHEAAEDGNDAAGCITTDFAMQNVILQIGLKLLAVDGRVIRRLKQWVYKCDACFFISARNLGTTFCPRCGSDAMKRLSVRVGSDGSVQYGYNPYRRISTRGQRYGIAKRKGGRAGQGLVLRADQALMGTWNVKVKEKQKLRSQFGEDITGSLGLDLQRAGGSLQAGFGRRNPNAMRGRERRGKKGLRKKKGKRFNPYRTSST